MGYFVLGKINHKPIFGLVQTQKEGTTFVFKLGKQILSRVKRFLTLNTITV